MSTYEQKRELKEKAESLINRRFGGQFEQAFSYYDADKDGKINRTELLEFLTDAHIGDGWGFNLIRERWADGILSELDKDIDGMLSKEELNKAINPVLMESSMEQEMKQEMQSSMDLETLVAKLLEICADVRLGTAAGYLAAATVAMEVIAAIGSALIQQPMKSSPMRATSAGEAEVKSIPQLADEIERVATGATAVDSILVDVVVPLLWVLVRRLLKF